jgi:hypothetical protein
MISIKSCNVVTLSTLRDTLLPKLLSGELQINCSKEVLHA